MPETTSDQILLLLRQADQSTLDVQEAVWDHLQTFRRDCEAVLGRHHAAGTFLANMGDDPEPEKERAEELLEQARVRLKERLEELLRPASGPRPFPRTS